MATHEETGQRRSGWALVGIGAVWAICIGVVAVVGVGLVASVSDGPPVQETSLVANTPPGTVVDRDGPRGEAGAVTPVPPSTTAVDPIPVSCWSTRRAPEDKGCQEQVVAKTKFATRYMTNQSALAKAHPAVKLADTGRQANSLARHGLLICWLIKEPRYSLDDIQSAFFLWFHRHQFTVPNDDTDAAANNILSIAVQEVCPSQAATFEAKGGPKAELVGGG